MDLRIQIEQDPDKARDVVPLVKRRDHDNHVSHRRSCPEPGSFHSVPGPSIPPSPPARIPASGAGIQPASLFSAASLVGVNPAHWLNFNTQAGCWNSSSGRSGSRIDTPPSAFLNFSGNEVPSKVTDLTPATSLTRNLRPGQRGRIA